MTLTSIESPMPEYERFRPPAWLTPAHISYWRYMERTDAPGIPGAVYSPRVALTPCSLLSTHTHGDPGQAAAMPPNPDCSGRATAILAALSVVAIAALIVGSAWLFWHPITWR
jgi:hypothetical protein